MSEAQKQKRWETIKTIRLQPGQEAHLKFENSGVVSIEIRERRTVPARKDSITLN